MVGRVALGQISQTLGQIFPEHSQLPFGGLSVLLIGDFGQLPPVGDTPLYNPNRFMNTSHSNRLSNLGRDAYLSFTESVELDNLMRQAGTDLESIAFREMLFNLRNLKPTARDHALLQTRF